MALSKKHEELSTHFFQVVVYPEERPLYRQVFDNLGIVFESPLHHANKNGPLKKIPAYTGKNAYNDGQNGFVFTYKPEPKDHIHLCVRTPRKITESSFIGQLMEEIKGDNTGIAIKTGLCAIPQEGLDTVLRYYLHLDIPNKEHFNFAEAIADTNTTWAPHVAKAYDMEIRYIVSLAIADGLTTNYEDVAFLFGRQNWVITAWLVRGKNSQFVYNEILGHTKKEYERSRGNYVKRK